MEYLDSEGLGSFYRSRAKGNRFSARYRARSVHLECSGNLNIFQGGGLPRRQSSNRYTNEAAKLGWPAHLCEHAPMPRYCFRQQTTAIVRVAGDLNPKPIVRFRRELELRLFFVTSNMNDQFI
jgi:hypothetical protein